MDRNSRHATDEQFSNECYHVVSTKTIDTAHFKALQIKTFIRFVILWNATTSTTKRTKNLILLQAQESLNILENIVARTSSRV